MTKLFEIPRPSLERYDDYFEKLVETGRPILEVDEQIASIKDSFDKEIRRLFSNKSRFKEDFKLRLSAIPYSSKYFPFVLINLIKFFEGPLYNNV